MTGERLASDAANILREFTFHDVLQSYINCGELHTFRGYIDDCFAILYMRDETQVAMFLQALNRVDPVQFRWTMVASQDAVNYLDLRICRTGLSLSTQTYKKPGCNPQYLAYTSHHPRSCRDAIYKGEITRHLLNCSCAAAYDIHTSALRSALRQRGHPDPPVVPYDPARRVELLRALQNRDRLQPTKASRKHDDIVIFKAQYGLHVRALRIVRECKNLYNMLRIHLGFEFLAQVRTVITYPVHSKLFLQHSRFNFLPFNTVGITGDS